LLDLRSFPTRRSSDLGGGILIAYGIISYIRTNKSIFKIVREHYAVKVKKNLGGLFLKGFLLNFVNFGVLVGWIGTLIMANALTKDRKSTRLNSSHVKI